MEKADVLSLQTEHSAGRQIFMGLYSRTRAHAQMQSITIALNSIYSVAGMESYNSSRLCVDGRNTDPVLRSYATSGQRCLCDGSKPQLLHMVWSNTALNVLPSYT